MYPSISVKVFATFGCAPRRAGKCADSGKCADAGTCADVKTRGPRKSLVLVTVNHQYAGCETLPLPYDLLVGNFDVVALSDITDGAIVFTAIDAAGSASACEHSSPRI